MTTAVKTTNYLVPSSGQTNCVPVTGTFSASPFLIDWRQYVIDNMNFQPQGVYIDNRSGTGTLTLTINPLGFVIEVPAGSFGGYAFPAPNGQTMTVTGLGAANLFFVDYPLLPSGRDVNLINTANVNIKSQSIPLLVTPSALAQGALPYVVNLEPLAASAVQYTITGAAVSGTATPTANTNMRYLHISASENASLAAAGIVTVTVTLNGIQVFNEGIYLPASATSIIGKTDIARIPFESVAFNAGAAGTLVTTISTALATGQIDVNAYFGA